VSSEKRVHAYSPPGPRRQSRLRHSIIAGYSADGHTVFIDRHLPRTFRWLMKTVRVEPFLLTHEIVEKALLDELRLHYLHAHQIAVRAERDAVKAAGVSWWAHQRFMKRHEKPIEEEKLVKVPAALDLTPYGDEKDFGLLQHLVRRRSQNNCRMKKGRIRVAPSGIAYQWPDNAHASRSTLGTNNGSSGFKTTKPRRAVSSRGRMLQKGNVPWDSLRKISRQWMTYSCMG
jgi:hypothetical protein